MLIYFPAKQSVGLFETGEQLLKLEQSFNTNVTILRPYLTNTNETSNLWLFSSQFEHIAKYSIPTYLNINI